MALGNGGNTTTVVARMRAEFMEEAARIVLDEMSGKKRGKTGKAYDLALRQAAAAIRLRIMAPPIGHHLSGV